MTFLLGLTGGIASGKSTASAYFQSQGYPVIDADLIAHQVLEKGSAGLAAVVAQFGKEILQEDGSLNRKKLGALVFSEVSERDKLAKITNQMISEKISQAILRFQKADEELVILDIPLLFEQNYQEKVTETLLIALEESVQIKRLMQRNALSKEEATVRIHSQMPLKEKLKKADTVIWNEGTIAQMQNELAKWLVTHHFKKSSQS